MRRSQPEVPVVKVMAVATTRRMRGNCAVSMLSMRAHSCLNGMAAACRYLRAHSNAYFPHNLILPPHTIAFIERKVWLARLTH
jgi:hypothetical protein